MTNPIDLLFSDRRTLKLMTHVVAGYPDLETTGHLIRLMSENGADLVEIQVPFSDPLADGPTIATANQVALNNGVTPAHCFRLLEKLKPKVKIPLLVMTYANIPYRMGLEVFVRRCCEVGVSGLIIPDLPFIPSELGEIEEAPARQSIGKEFPCWGIMPLTKRYGCYAVPVVSPGMPMQRLEEIVKLAQGFIYATLRVGITGARPGIDEKGITFLEALKNSTSLPIAAGFGIASLEMVDQLKNRANAVVIGSHIINLLNCQGIKGVIDFLQSLARCCRDRKD